jgi:hypothetical protein
MREIDVTPLIRPSIRPAWLPARREENLVGALACVLIAAVTLAVVVS